MLKIRFSTPQMPGLVKNLPIRPRVSFYSASATPNFTSAAPNTTSLSLNATRAAQHPPGAPPTNQQLEELDSKWYKRHDQLEGKWYLRSQELNHLIQGQCSEISILRSLALQSKTENLKLERNFNLRGALERTVYQARLLKKIKGTMGTGIQAGIKELAKTSEFLDIFNAEVARRGLVPMITVRIKDHTPNELAALACFLILQSTWPDSLAWREVVEDEDTMGEVTENEETPKE
ncbi:hypothetical protein B9Z19DRAFT_1197466 [Tuber borchii]|uniref:Uncharacterized protein n=1 Tax=Tuber borchii TaxID=42251 RepID=A0A2T6ZAT4_TUBBO|nr:hypothetical protein B9Z19DRAFT_1197466 [Tuber borchii]